MTSTPTSTSTSSMLRASTRGEHLALESSALARELMSSDLCLARYLEILQIWAQAWDSLERTLEQSAGYRQHADLLPRPRAALAAQDLAGLGRPPSREAQSGPSRAVSGAMPAPAATPSELLGMGYVLRGSSLGGRVIARHVRSMLRLPCGLGTSFFEQADDDAAGWGAWLRELDIRVASPAQRQDCLRGALSVFAFLQHVFAAPHAGPAVAREAA